MQSVYDLMAARLQQPDMQGFLTHFRQDFYEHDKAILLEWGAPGVEYLWGVRETGTELHRLAVHARAAEWFQCAISHEWQAYKVFHVSDRGLREITRDKAREMLKRFDYASRATMNGFRMLRGDTPIADLVIRVESRPCDSPLHHVEIQSLVPLTSRLVGDIRTWAHGELQQQHSMWAQIGSTHLDGMSFADAIAACRKREQPVAAAAAERPEFELLVA